MQRREAVFVRHGCFRARADQQIGDREIVDMRSPMERGRAIALRSIDIDALLDERAHGWLRLYRERL